MKSSSKYFLIVFLFLFQACSSPNPSVEILETIPAQNDSRESENEGPDRNVFFISMMRAAVSEQAKQTVYKKMLGDWRDGLQLIKKDHLKTPLVITMSGPMVKILAELSSEDVEIILPSYIVKEKKKLSAEDIKYLEKHYSDIFSTTTILDLQIKEIFTYLGEDLKSEEAIMSIVEKSSYTIADKQNLISRMKEGLHEFPVLLKQVLDYEKVEEAITSLSDANVTMLDDERTKVQILESMVQYKLWRERFPDGFIPRAGLLNEEACKQLQKTDINWVILRSTEPQPYLLTKPQVLFADSFFLKNNDKDQIFEYLNQTKPRKKIPEIFINNFADIKYFLNDRTFNFSDTQKMFKKTISLAEEDYVMNLSSATVLLSNNFVDNNYEKLSQILGSVRDIVYKYRNSGKARLNVLTAIQKKLLVAESGDICEGLGLVSNDRLFRKSLVDIYDMINILPPKSLYIPILERDADVIDQEMTAFVDVKCDGIIDPGEWQGALKDTVSDKGIKEVYCGMDKSNMYFMFDFNVVDSTNVPSLEITGSTQVTNSTISVITDAYLEPEILSAGVYVGHMDYAQAAMFPRNAKKDLENIQDFPINLDVFWRRTVPKKTIVYRTTHGQSWEVISGNYNVGYSSGILEFSVPFKYISPSPKKKIYFKVYSDQGIPTDTVFSVTVPDLELTKSIISYIDPLGDQTGPGNYTFTKNFEEYKSNFDLRKIDVNEKDEENLISLEFSSIDNSDTAPFEFSHIGIDIYIDINNREGLGNDHLLPGRNGYTVPEHAWEFCVSVNGWNKAIYNASGRKIGEPEISISQMDRTINIFIDKDMISSAIENWAIIPVVIPVDNAGNLNPVVKSSSDELKLIYGRKNISDTNIIDIVLPPGYRQKTVLGANRKNKAIEIPALKKR